MNALKRFCKGACGGLLFLIIYASALVAVLAIIVGLATYLGDVWGVVAGGVVSATILFGVIEVIAGDRDVN